MAVTCGQVCHRVKVPQVKMNQKIHTPPLKMTSAWHQPADRLLFHEDSRSPSHSKLNSGAYLSSSPCSVSSRGSPRNGFIMPSHRPVPHTTVFQLPIDNCWFCGRPMKELRYYQPGQQTAFSLFYHRMFTFKYCCCLFVFYS